MDRKFRFLLFLYLSFFASVLTGCAGFRALTFEKHENSGKTEGQSLEINYFYDGKIKTFMGPGKRKAELFEGVEVSDGLVAELNDPLAKCGVAIGEEVPVAAVPVIAAAGKFIFDIGSDYLAGVVKKVQQKSKATYGAKILVDESILEMNSKKKECLLFYRHRKEKIEGGTEDRVGMVLVVEVEKLKKTVTFVPTFLWIGEAVAETADEPKPTIDAAIAIKVKVVEKGLVNPVSMNNVVEETFQFKKIVLGGPAKKCETKECKIFSDLIVPPQAKEPGATISIAVVETGSHASHLDKAEAQLAALKAALGPAAKEALTKALSSE